MYPGRAQVQLVTEQTLLKNRGRDICISCPLRSLLISSSQWNITAPYLWRPFFFYPITFYFTLVLFSVAPLQRTHTFVICFVSARAASARGVAAPFLHQGSGGGDSLLFLQLLSWTRCALPSVHKFYLGVTQGFWLFFQEFRSPMEVIAPR